MKILYINHYAGSPKYGMEYRPYYMAKHWVSMGHEVTILAASHSHVRTSQPLVESEFRDELIDGIRFRWLKTLFYSGNGIRRMLNMLSFVRAVYRQKSNLVNDFSPDVVIASSTYPWDIYPAFAIAKKANAKLVFEVHDLWPLSPMELGGMSAWHPFIMALQHGEDFACKRAEIVISMLPKADSHLFSRGMSKEKFFYVPNGIEITEWQNDCAEVPPVQNQLLTNLANEGKFIVAYAGAHGVANALEFFVRAGKQLVDLNVALVLVGNGPEKQNLQKIANEENLANVFFVDAIPKATIPSFLKKCDALYIGLQKQPLFRFGISPNKLMDYMAAGRPVIQAIEAGNDPVKDAKCGISIVAEDSHAIANAIREIANKPFKAREEMGKSGQEYVRDHHDYSVLAVKFLNRLKMNDKSR